MQRKNYDKDMINKMHDIIELINILNRLTKDCYEDDTKEYLLDMIDNMENIKYSHDKYRLRHKEFTGCNCGSFKRNSLADKILFYLKSLNG